MNHKELKSKVLGKFFSITAFAEAIGWSRNKASRIINGMQEPSCDDIVDLTNVLDLGAEIISRWEVTHYGETWRLRTGDDRSRVGTHV